MLALQRDPTSPCNETQGQLMEIGAIFLNARNYPAFNDNIQTEHVSIASVSSSITTEPSTEASSALRTCYDS
jgi:hypothetical protein